MASEWYCKFGDRVDGTYTVAELLRMAADGVLAPTDKVRRGAGGEWIEARRLPGLTFPGDQVLPADDAIAEKPVPARRARPEPEPEPEQPRRRRREGPDEFDAEELADILSRPFDSPRIRAERLLALTGGEVP